MDRSLATPYFLPTPRASSEVAEDPTLDVLDGSQVIQVTTLFGDSVIGVRHLADPASGSVQLRTWGLLALGGIALLGGVAALAVGQLGLATLALLAGLSIGVLGALRVREERRSPHFIVGEGPDADVPLAGPQLPSAAFPLVRSTGTDYSLSFTPTMDGDVTVGSQRIRLAELAAPGRAQVSPHCAGAYAWPIPPGARIKVDIGESTFLVNAVAPARQLRSTMLGGMDWPTQMFNGLSFGTHVLILFLVFSVPPGASALNIDQFNTDSSRIKYLVRAPEGAARHEVPTWLRKNVDQPAGKAGAAAKGPSGKMGNPEAKHRGGRVALAGDQPNLQLARRLAMENVKNMGVLGLLGSREGGTLASIFSRHTAALGNDAETAIGGLIGDHTGEDYGVGGLGISGTGRGGGGTADEAVGMGGPLGTIGRGGGGPGSWGYGRCVGTRCGLGPRKPAGPQLVAEGVRVKGSLDKEIIRRVIRSHLNEVRYCYQHELQSKPDLYGRIVVQFTITPTGQVMTAKIDQTTLNNVNVEGCVTQATRRWTFPRPENGIVVVSYPFLFHTPNADR
jgi:hypothetical protein